MAIKKLSTNKDCVFCKIAGGKLAADLRYVDCDMVAFDDINPHAPVHVLVVPKKHIVSLTDVTKKDEALLGKMLFRCKELAKELNIADNGYRVTINVGRWGGQVVPHLHIHLLGGAPLSERLAHTAAKVALSARR